MPETNAVANRDPLLALLSQDNVKKRFEQLLGGRAGAAFVSSIVSAVNSNEALAKVAKENPTSVIAAGIMAATLNLPVTPGLGWAAIVPFKGAAVLQVMKDGYVQLALRTGQYRSINCSDVYEDEFSSWNPHTGELKTRPQDTWEQREAGKTDKIVGYLAFFELLNGFKKYTYWTIKQLEVHGKKYSQSYGYGKGLWMTDKPVMYMKTPLKLLIRHFGPMSTQMQYAMEFDQASRKPDGTVEYPDGRPVETTTVSTEDLIKEPKKLEKPAKAKEKPEPIKKSQSQSATKPNPPVEEKPYPPEDAEGPMACLAEKDCANCADSIKEQEKMYRWNDEDGQPQYAHAEHFQAPE